jgi:uncharacterized protein (TIGR00299 family) protein
MTTDRFAILDPAAGISGDMLLGALIAAGASEAWLQGLPARLGLEGVEITVRRVSRCGVASVKVDVQVRGETEGPHGDASGHGHAAGLAEAPVASATREDHGAVDDDGRARLLRDGPEHSHPHADAGHDHHHPHGHSQPHTHDHDDAHSHAHAHGHQHGPHRRVGDLIAIVQRAPLSEWVRVRAVEALRLLGDAEGRVHGLPAEDVPLHEVGAMDALVDIVGGIEGFEQLGLRRVYTGPVTLGNGWVRCAHGVMPVPAPATAMLIEGLEIGPNGPVTGEATTPTGAVLLRVLTDGPAPARWRPISGDAWGAGGRDPGAWPNALRLFVAESAMEASTVVIVASDLDDLSPEYLEPLRDALMQAGALDVQSWTTLGKKGRAGFRVEAQVPAAQADAVAEAFLTHSSTIGVRRWTAERRTLPRRTMDVSVDGSTIRVKVVDAPGGPRAKAEYDDVTAAALRSGRPALDVAREAQTQALTALQARN